MNPQEAKKELARRELARRNFKDFVLYTFDDYDLNWHHEKIMQTLQKVFTGEIKRLAITMPPRHGKSELASIRFPAWVLGKDPNRKVVTASYGSDLASDFGFQTRNLVDSKEYKAVFNTRLAKDSKSKGFWHTSGEGYYLSVGVGSALTGKGADLLLIDDPHKDREEADSPTQRQKVHKWYTSTARTRMSANGAIILIQTRWHDDDLYGRIVDEDWHTLDLPAIARKDEEERQEGDALWANRFDVDTLQEIKKDVGGYDWSALYQGVPIDEESQEFKKKWFQTRDWEEVVGIQTRCFITVDTRGSDKVKDGEDYIGITVNFVDISNAWNLISYRVKFTGKDFVEHLFSLYDTYDPEKIGIEKTSYTEGLKPFMEQEMDRRNKYLPIEELSHRRTMKETRIRGLIPRYEMKKVFHIKQDGKNTCADLEAELLRFPKSAHDDTMDSCAYQDQIAEQPHFADNLQQQRIHQNRQANRSMK